MHPESLPFVLLAVLAGAAHLTPWDARGESVRVVRGFLRRTDSTVTHR